MAATYVIRLSVATLRKKMHDLSRDVIPPFTYSGRQAGRVGPREEGDAAEGGRRQEARDRGGHCSHHEVQEEDAAQRLGS